MEEVLSARIAEYVDDFRDPQARMVLASVAEGNTEAQLWTAAQCGEEAALLLWDKGNNVFYLSGDIPSEDTRDEFAALIAAEIKERAIQERLMRFKVRALSHLPEESLAALFPDVPLRRTIKLFYVFTKPQRDAVPAPALEGVGFELIDSGFLERTRLQNLEYVRAEIEWMWPSLDRFCGHGFGFAAVLEERIICWCTAEYVSGASCGVGIETLPEFQRKGIATAAAARFVDYCKGRNVTPHWECGSRHAASVRVAEKAGFDLMQEAPFWSGAFRM